MRRDLIPPLTVQMYTPLIVEEKDSKWLLLKTILKFFDTRTAKKILAREKRSALKKELQR